MVLCTNTFCVRRLLRSSAGYGRGYNLAHKDQSGLTYLPEGWEDREYFD